MAHLIQVSQVTSGILLILSVLLQHRGTGLGGAFGGEGVSYRSRRGVEQLLFRATVVLAAIFLATSIGGLFV